MTPVRIALTELRRITAGRLPRLAVLALVLIPTLYGGLYLVANHDPYANLSYVPAAIVVADQGTRDATGKQVHAGAEVARELARSKSFDWHQVTADEARAGVRNGTYDFALTIPSGFSAALTSSSSVDPRQAQIQMTTNDASSYLSTTIANTLTDKVRDALATRVSRETSANFLLGISQIRSSLVQAADSSSKLTVASNSARDDAVSLAKGARTAQQGAGRLQSSAATVDTGLGALEDDTKGLPQQTSTLASGAKKVADGNDTIATDGRKVAHVANRAATKYANLRAVLITTMQQQGLNAFQQEAVLGVYDAAGPPIRQTDRRVRGLSAQLDSLAVGADQVAAGTKKLATSTPGLATAVSKAHDSAAGLATGAGSLKKGTATLATGADTLDTGLTKLATGAAQVQQGLRQGARKVPAPDEQTRDRVARTIGNPVDVTSASPASAGSYGAGLAPVFLSLAAWIGGYVMFLLIRPLSRRAMAANQSSLRVALGGWLTPALIGVAQMAVLFVLVLVGLHIVPSHLLGTLGFLVLTSATFVAIVHALNAWFGRAGQLLALVLMVVQLVTAGGTFPWQTIPLPLHWLHHALPMSYTVDGLRQLMYGGLDSIVLRDVGVLAAYLLAALILSAVAARRQRVWTSARIKPELVL